MRWMEALHANCALAPDARVHFMRYIFLEFCFFFLSSVLLALPNILHCMLLPVDVQSEQTLFVYCAHNREQHRVWYKRLLLPSCPGAFAVQFLAIFCFCFVPPLDIRYSTEMVRVVHLFGSCCLASLIARRRQQLCQRLFAGKFLPSFDWQHMHAWAAIKLKANIRQYIDEHKHNAHALHIQKKKMCWLVDGGHWKSATCRQKGLRARIPFKIRYINMNSLHTYFEYIAFRLLISTLNFYYLQIFFTFFLCIYLLFTRPCR